MYICSDKYCRVPFFQRLQISQMKKKEFIEIIFMTLAELFTIHMNLHTMEFPLIFDETNFVELSPKNL